MGTYFFCCTTVTQGQIVQILLLHVKKQGQIWAVTPHNSKQYKTYADYDMAARQNV